MVCNERTGVEVIDEFVVVNGVDAAIGEGCWWGRWVEMDIFYWYKLDSDLR